MCNTAELVEDRADIEPTQVDKYMTRKEVAERCRVPLSTFEGESNSVVSIPAGFSSS